jgi:hypothetical protein
MYGQKYSARYVARNELQPHQSLYYPENDISTLTYFPLSEYNKLLED